jgi:ribosomal protein S15P/S13E
MKRLWFITRGAFGEFERAMIRRIAAGQTGGLEVARSGSAMSALLLKADITRGDQHVRFVPKSGHSRRGLTHLVQRSQ